MMPFDTSFEQDRQGAYHMTLWLVSVTFVPLGYLNSLITVSNEESAFMAI